MLTSITGGGTGYICFLLIFPPILDQIAKSAIPNLVTDYNLYIGEKIIVAIINFGLWAIISFKVFSFWRKNNLPNYEELSVIIKYSILNFLAIFFLGGIIASIILIRLTHLTQ